MHLLDVKKIILGNRNDTDNPLQWKKVILNLPGRDSYVSYIPSIYLLRCDGKMSGYFGTYKREQIENSDSATFEKMS